MMYRFNSAMYLARLARPITRYTRIFRAAAILFVAALAGIVLLTDMPLAHRGIITMVLCGAVAFVLAWGLSMCIDFINIHSLKSARVSVDDAGIHYCISFPRKQACETIVHPGAELQIHRCFYLFKGAYTVIRSNDKEHADVRHGNIAIPRFFVDEDSFIKSVRKYVNGYDENCTFVLSDDVDYFFAKLRLAYREMTNDRFSAETRGEAHIHVAIDTMLACYFVHPGPGGNDSDDILKLKLQVAKLTNAIEEIAGLSG